MGKYQVHQSDQNEKRLIEYLRARGAQVEKIHQPLDWLVAFHGVSGVAECKREGRYLRESQIQFIRVWDGICDVVETEADCDAFLKRLQYPDLDYLVRASLKEKTIARFSKSHKRGRSSRSNSHRLTPRVSVS